MATLVTFSTIGEMFEKITARFADSTRPMLMYKENKQYRNVYHREYRQQVELFALGLASLGVRPGDTLAIIAENRPEWIVADMAMVVLGAVNVPIYPTLTPKQIEFIFNDAGVTVAIVSNALQLGKVQKIRSEVKTLQHCIAMTPQNDPSVLSYSTVYGLGEAHKKNHPALFEERLKQVKPEDLLTIIYTSGTTGNPKGVMLTHHNMASNIQSSAKAIPFGPTDLFLSFLPLCHSFERMAGYYTAMACGVTVAYAESVETVRENLLEIKPTIVTTVPRLFERIHSRIMKQVDNSPPFRQKVFHWGVKVGKLYAEARRNGNISPLLALKRKAAHLLVFKKIQERTGGRMRFFVSGGAALPKPLGEFFEAVGIQIIEGYGLTETSPVLCANRLEDYKFGTVGTAIEGVEINIAGDGEILARGPNIMKGYYNNPEATREVIDAAGWFHTGDVGMFDTEGHLMITDRKKHLFVSSGGKNIAPQPIENHFLECKYIDQFVLIGDGRMFLTALIVPDFDTLKDWARGQSFEFASELELVANPEVRRLFQTEIDAIQKEMPNYERVRRFELLPAALTVENGEITPTLKVKRKVIEQKYADVIERMYEKVA